MTWIEWFHFLFQRWIFIRLEHHDLWLLWFAFSCVYGKFLIWLCLRRLGLNDSASSSSGGSSFNLNIMICGFCGLPSVVSSMVSFSSDCVCDDSDWMIPLPVPAVDLRSTSWSGTLTAPSRVFGKPDVFLISKILTWLSLWLSRLRSVYSI